MFNRKVLSGVLSAVMLCSAMSVSAAGFKDVENVDAVAWAEPYINEMAELGYIKGYEDGTFQPNKSISKTEALILLSRMIGVNEEEYAESVEFALEEYKDAFEDYKTDYKKEVSFLLYRGILSEDELGDYISTSNKNTPLKRFEAAILLTKLLGAEAEVKSNAFVSSTYADAIDIPDESRAYVEYVKEAGIMQGMGNDATGAPTFSPNTAVTRAQMAKMLCTLIDVLDISSYKGVVVSIDDFDEEITIDINGKSKIEKISAATVYKMGGKAVTADELPVGSNVKVTLLHGKVALVEEFEVIEDAIIKGLVSATRTSGSTKSVTIADANDVKDVKNYNLSKEAVIKVGGAIEAFSKIKANQYVALTISDGLVTALEVIDKNSSASGTLVSVDAAGDVTVLNVENSKGDIVPYEVSVDGVQVSRNNLSSSLAALMEGDEVNLKLTYDKVTKVLASSKNQNLSGTISFITYSTNGTKIGIESGGTVSEYTVNKSVEVLVNSTEGTVYDLRPGSDIKIKLQSSEIISIEAAGAVSKSQLTGTIKSINATYGLMVIEENGVEYNVFTNSNTKIIDSVTGATVMLKTVEKDRIATVTGSNSSGVLEAKVVVLQ